jgi:hypothetical protein
MMWIELHLLHAADHDPVFINFARVTEIRPAKEGTVISFGDDENYLVVQEDYAVIKKYIIDRLSGR